MSTDENTDSKTEHDRRLSADRTRADHKQERISAVLRHILVLAAEHMVPDELDSKVNVFAHLEEHVNHEPFFASTIATTGG